MSGESCFQRTYFDYSIMEEVIENCISEHKFIKVGIIGKSIYGRRIPLITLGKGSKSVIYVGAHHGMEWITSALLMKFVMDYAKEYSHGNNVYDISTRVLFETRKIHVIPMLNPDGIEYCIHGVNDDNVLRNRLIKINGNSINFSNWQANGRGVDLNHNYASGFKEYKIIERKLGLDSGAPSKYSGPFSESEPETSALCNFVRIDKPYLAISLHTQGEEIFYTSGEKSTEASLPIVKTLSRLTGYKISIPTGTASYGGFTDWFIEEFDRPSFTFECGLGKNPLPYGDLDKIYTPIKRALFTAPILI